MHFLKINLKLSQALALYASKEDKNLTLYLKRIVKIVVHAYSIIQTVKDVMVQVNMRLALNIAALPVKHTKRLDLLGTIMIIVPILQPEVHVPGIRDILSVNSVDDK